MDADDEKRQEQVGCDAALHPHEVSKIRTSVDIAGSGGNVRGVDAFLCVA